MEFLKEFVKSIFRVNCDKTLAVDPVIEHTIIGLADETGELVTVLKRAKYYSEPIDDIHLMEEYGDMLYYIVLDLSRIAHKRHKSIEEIFMAVLDQNIAKLRARYPDGWDQSKAQTQNRNLEAEKSVMQKVQQAPYGGPYEEAEKSS